MSFTDPEEPVPAELRTDEFVLRPIVADDAELDHAAIMETREDLRLWEQSTWPADDFTVEANREDLVGLERRHAEHRAFTYTVQDPEGVECLGCVYIFPTTAAFLARSAVTPVGSDSWADTDAVIYFWVRTSRMQTRMDERLLATLRAWFDEEWKLKRTVYVVNEQFRHQVDLVIRAGLELRFEIVEPGKAGTYLAFG
ncbi:N-acetyltransferase [Humibacter sp. RRB41]|uniref:N-acetyltransferase n=1 Tax=Humibacter sp. RRB41 TaxID=2919946 RepID=UPI001FAACD71|nr:N-acetyltransferase [Humibacter sp. RRB41]